jgi:MoaA/NifB/PqqE/SkfB family radical SAM enzyme
MAEIKNISVLNFVPQGRGLENKEKLLLTPEELKEFSEILKQEKAHYSGNIRIGIPLNGQISHLCTAGTEKLDIKYDGTILPCPAFKEMSVETMEKYGIKLYSIYEDLEKVTIKGGKRKTPLCKQVYGFNANLVESDEILK